MSVIDQHIGPGTPMGATLVAGGATFRTWAPTAPDVYVVTDDLPAASARGWVPGPEDRLVPLGDGTWAGFVPGVREGDPYLFWIRGLGDSGFKRDPYARELGVVPPFPDCPCLVRDPRTYPWHDSAWRPPPFEDVIIYQLHVGVFWAVDERGADRRRAYGRFLDVLERIVYLRDLGVTTIQLLPIQEYDQDFGLGYSGLDYFSPEMAYQVRDPVALARHLGVANDLLRAAGQVPLSLADIQSGPNQLKCLVDLCHVYGLGVIFDVVYNHAGGGFGDRDLYYYDRQPRGDDRRSLYFGLDGVAGGKVFDYQKDPVRQFLIDNALFFLDEYHVDGFRYDEISEAVNHGGSRACRDLAAAVRFARPQALQIAEYWNWDRARAVTPPPDGLGFDAALADGLRERVRGAVRQAAGGAGAYVDLDLVRDALAPPAAFPAWWRAVQCLENHDTVRWDYGQNAPRDLRVPALADYANPTSWYARSRSRVATVLLFTAPGITALFMGQELLEARPWHDDVAHWSQFLIDWTGLAGDPAKRDFKRFVQDLAWLRRSRPALRASGLRVSQVHNHDRVIVVHRWVPGQGRDVVTVASLNEQPLDDYAIDLPWPGTWYEIFNSDVYDGFPNPAAVGNAGQVVAGGDGRFGYPWSCRMRIPANGAIVLARER